MSLEFTVSGGNIRTFLSVLLCVSKIGDVVFFIALKDGIELSAVTSTRNGHIAVCIDERCFDHFHFTPPTPASHPSSSAEKSETRSAENEEAHASGELSLCVLAKTLTATLLRQHNNANLQRIEFSYDTSVAHPPKQSSDDNNNNTADGRANEFDEKRSDADMVRWTCHYTRNITKTFLLRLAEGAPTSVCTDAARYHFEVCGDARTYGSLLASLPSSTSQCGLTLLESGGLELRSISSTQQQQQQQQQSRASSPLTMRRKAALSSAAAAAGAAALSADGSAAVVTAFAKSFHLFHFFDVVCAPADSSTTQPPQQQQEHPSETGPDKAVVEARHIVMQPFVHLPGKVFDVKPFKQAAWLAEQLGVCLCLRCGEAGMPLVFSSITPEEVQERKAVDNGIATADTTTGTMTRHDQRDIVSGRGRGTAYNNEGNAGFGGVPPSSFHRSARSTAEAVAVPAYISFTVHVAALDVASSLTAVTTTTTTAAAAAATDVGGTAVGHEAIIATATSSVVNTPRASAHYPSSTSAATTTATTTPTRGQQQQRQSDGERNASVGERTPVDFVKCSSANSIFVSATRSSMNMPLGGSSSNGSEGVYASADTAHAAWVTPTPSHGESNRPSQPQNTLPRATAVHTPSCVKATFGGTNPSLSSPSDLVMVMTGDDDTPENRGNVRHVSPDNGNQTNASSSGALGMNDVPLPQPQPQLQPSSSCYTAASLSTMYPLDFDVFARNYTTQQDIEAGEEDAQDAELREFLASCVASMSRGPTQN